MFGEMPMNKSVKSDANTHPQQIGDSCKVSVSESTNSPLSKVTPMIITYNEEANISRTLDQLKWARRIVVIDSYSTDNTRDILNNYPNVEVVNNPFHSFAEQCNFGLSLVKTEWVLSLDADYVLPNDFIEEMEMLLAQPTSDAFFASFKFCVFGKPLRADNTTARKVLYRKDKAHYQNVGHQHRVQVEGETPHFKNQINHDDRKSLSRWLKSQDKYLLIEAKKLNATSYSDLDLVDKVRKTKIFAPFLIFFWCLFVRALILDGWRGWYYTFQRTLVEILLAIRLIEIEKFDS